VGIRPDAGVKARCAVTAARAWLGIAFALAATAAAAQGPAPAFPPEQIRKGAAIYDQNCAPCHGPRMLDPNSAFDLRTFPSDQKSRFFNSVAKGKNAMPPWGDLFKGDEIEALWAYVMAGER
jgi:mono/diheme cytochrome c family protein